MDLGDALSGGRDFEAAADKMESPPSGTWPVYRLIEASARESTPDARDSPLRRR